MLAVVHHHEHLPVGGKPVVSAYYQMMGKSLLLPGLIELAQTAVPTQLVFCEKDRVFPRAATVGISPSTCLATPK